MAVSSYARLPLPLPIALRRFGEWIALPELEPPRRVRSRDAFDLACTGNGWRGVAVFAHEAKDWSVFDDYTGYLAGLPAARWIALAGNEELVFAGYNDAVPYGQLTVVREGRIVRQFLQDLQDPSNDINRGRLELERATLIDDWVDAAWFVDSDELSDDAADEGTLLLYQTDDPLGGFSATRTDDR